MEQLILTFFAIILCFSLFFDKKTEKPLVDKINYIHDETPKISGIHYEAPDTMNFLTLYNNENTSSLFNSIYVASTVPPIAGTSSNITILPLY